MAVNQQTQAAGTTLRGAIEALNERLGEPASAQFNYMYATANNLLVSLEKADGVPGGTYGSTGGLMPEFNPVTGTQVGPPTS